MINVELVNGGLAVGLQALNLASLSNISIELRQWHRARLSLVQTLQLDLPCCDGAPRST